MTQTVLISTVLASGVHDFDSLRQRQYICVHCFSVRFRLWFFWGEGRQVCKRTIQWPEITMGRIYMDRGIELFHRIMKSLEIVWHLSSNQWAQRIPDYHRANHLMLFVDVQSRRYSWNGHDLNHKSCDVFRFVRIVESIQIKSEFARRTTKKNKIKWK